MIMELSVAHPERLWAILAWALLVAAVLVHQRPALRFLDAHVAPRHRRRLTRYTTRGLLAHGVFLFFAGALLVVAAAGPYVPSYGERVVATRDVLLLLDASLSMGATDTTLRPGTTEKPEHRFAEAKAFARELVEARPDDRFALVTFSGTPVVHAPPTRDRRALLGLLETLGYHVDLTRSGTRFSSVFDVAIHFARDRAGGAQVVLLSDGELPQGDAYEPELEVLRELGVPVHAVGFGTRGGEGRVIYHPDDIRAGLEQKRVVREYRTRREDEALRRLARATGGVHLTVAEGDWVDDLLPRVEAVEPRPAAVPGRGRRDLARYPLAVFALLFLVETLWIAARPGAAGPRAARAGSSRASAGSSRARAATLVLLLGAALLVSGCRSRLLQAHFYNERGIESHAAGAYPVAEPLYEKSASFGLREHVPLYNLANTTLARRAHARAHQQYQEVLLRRPDLLEAHFNDGHALYRWGEDEIDPTGCRLERSRELWRQARGRFERVAEAGGELAAAAEANLAFLDRRFDDLDRLAEECPESSGGGGQAEDPAGGGGQAEDPAGGGGNGEDGEGGEGGGEEGRDGGGGGAGEDGEAGGGGALTPEEEQAVRAALERIEREAAAAGGYRQSRAQQLTPEMLEQASGRELWW